jgi:ankyrin repeat protein
MKDQEVLEVLLDGIRKSDAQAVKAALEAAPNVLSDRVMHYETGEVPLHVACAVGSTTIIQILMEAGADLNQRDGKGRTALKVLCFALLC